MIIKLHVAKGVKEGIVLESLSTNSSRLPGFYLLPISERAEIISKFGGFNVNQVAQVDGLNSLSKNLADTFIENAIGCFSLPLGVATNFKVNNKDILIPMAVEESSVVAAASHGAKLARHTGGFVTSSSDPIMTGQVQVFLPKNTDFDSVLTEKKQDLINYANRGQDRLLKRGGGVKDLTWYEIPEIKSLIIMLHVHTCDAMGANIVNTVSEKLSLALPKIFSGCDLGLRILTNLTSRRVARAECEISPDVLSGRSMQGEDVIDKIIRAWEFAWYDPYRAATHNKGVMNGIDPVVIATGNDWRAVEAGAHAHCSLTGKYRPMTKWNKLLNGSLKGKLELPIAVGTVGGVTKLHPTAQISLGLLGHPSAQGLAEILCAVGLAQNLSALRALATEGIQQGHMSLHQKNLNLNVLQKPKSDLLN